MKKPILLLFILALSFSCKNTNKQQVAAYKIVSEIESKTKDTIISLTENTFFHFTKRTHFKDGTIGYQNRYIITEKGDTLTKLTTNYSELLIKLSPNKDYLITDDIIRGYVYTSETDSILHENYLCQLINIKTGNLVDTFQSGCGGEWNADNQWVSGDDIIFDASEL